MYLKSLFFFGKGMLLSLFFSQYSCTGILPGLAGETFSRNVIIAEVHKAYLLFKHVRQSSDMNSDRFPSERPYNGSVTQANPENAQDLS